MKKSMFILASALMTLNSFANVQPGRYIGKIVGSNKPCFLNISSVAPARVVDYQGRAGVLLMQTITYTTSLASGVQTTNLSLACRSPNCGSFEASLREATEPFKEVVIYVTSNPNDHGSSIPAYVSSIPSYVPYQVATHSTVCSISNSRQSL